MATYTYAPRRSRRGVEQYTRIADHLAEEGFYAKALALFKKILKLKPDHEYSLLQSGDLAAKQGTLADAKQFFTQVADKRKARGDKKGAAEVAIKLGTLDPEDLDARMRAAQLAGEMGDTATALREYREVAGKLKKADKHGDMLVPLQKAYDLDKSDDGVRSQLFSAYLDTESRRRAQGGEERRRAQADRRRPREGRRHRRRARRARGDRREGSLGSRRARRASRWPTSRRGDLEKARTYLSAETAGTNPALWLMLAEMELRADAIPRRQGRGRPGPDARSPLRHRRPSSSHASWPRRIRKPGISRSMRSPTPRSRRAISPPPR